MQPRNIFSGITTENLEDNRDELSNQLVTCLNSIVRDCKIDKHSCSNYSLLREINGMIFSELPFATILKRCQNLKLSALRDGFTQMQQCLDDLTEFLISAGIQYEASSSERAESPKSPITEFKQTSSPKTTPTRPATTREKIKFQLQLLDTDKPKDELVKLLIATEAQEAKINTYFINVNKFFETISDAEQQLKNIFELIDTLIKKNPQNRIHIVLRIRRHYTNLDIDPISKSCFIADAASSNKKFILRKMAKYIKSITVFDTSNASFMLESNSKNKIGALQKDQVSCWFFSVYMLRVLANIPNLHQSLAKWGVKKTEEDGSVYHMVDWIHFNPDVVKISQTSDFLDHYMTKNPTQKDTLLKLTNQNQLCYGFVESCKLLLKKTTALLEICKDEKLEEMVASIDMTSYQDAQVATTAELFKMLNIEATPPINEPVFTLQPATPTAIPATPNHPSPTAPVFPLGRRQTS